MQKRNIIFILVDDLGWMDLSCQGSKFYETPNIDLLASHSMKFTNAYAASPVCSPTRASILTGKYPARVGVTNWIDPSKKVHPCRSRLIDAPYVDHLPLEETSLATALREGGYQTWHVGKWHLGDEPYYPQEHGFDVNVGGCERGAPGMGGYFSPWDIPVLQDVNVPEGTYLDDYLTDRALELIHHRDHAKPFFLNLWFYLVHTPIQAPTDLIEKYTEKARRLGLDKVKDYEEGEPYPCHHKAGRRIRRRVIQSDPVYAAMLEKLDENVGRLIAFLENTSLRDNTMIIFTSDNGGESSAEPTAACYTDLPPTCNAPLSEGKGWMYEGGTREPLFMDVPNLTSSGSTCDVPVSSPDFYPTLLEAAELDPRPAQHVDGVSLVPLLRGKEEFSREAIFWHYPHYSHQGGRPACSVRSGNWKLIEFFEDGRLELYNLHDDIGENTNLTESHPKIRNQLYSILQQWKSEIHVSMPTTNQDYVE